MARTERQRLRAERRRGHRSRPGGEGGFTLIEFMISALIMTAALGSTMMLASQIQQAYTTQLDDVTVEEEVRFALDWITEALRKAGSNPYDIETSDCPAAGTPFQAIRITDLNGNGIQDEIQIQADITGSPTAVPPVTGPDALLGGTAGSCNQADEDITIAHDTVNLVITRQDNNGGVAVTMTEALVTQLLFTYLDDSLNVTADPDTIAYVRVRITGRSSARNLNLGDFATFTLEREVRVRTR